MRVLVACEFSGIVREAFKARGHDAWSCDILPTEIPGQHFEHDIRSEIIWSQYWDLLIAHPPCTRLTNSGVRWLEERNLWAELDEAADFFKIFLDAPVEKIVIENPIPHKYAIERIGRKYDQIIQPFQFGHPESKKTCLWLKNLPKLIETNNVKEEMLLLPRKEQQRVHNLSPSADRWKIRSRTYSGIAEAMASQWG